MANVFVKDEGTHAEENRPNLLDVVEERNRSQNKVPVFQFIRYITNISVVVVINCGKSFEQPLLYKKSLFCLFGVMISTSLYSFFVS